MHSLLHAIGVSAAHSKGLQLIGVQLHEMTVFSNGSVLPLLP
jgi:hypothetical protein